MTDPEVIARLDRIEHMLTVLIDALAGDEPEEDEFGSERDQGQEL